MVDYEWNKMELFKNTLLNLFAKAFTKEYNRVMCVSYIICDVLCIRVAQNEAFKRYLIEKE